METIPNYDRWQEVERLRGERNAVANKMKGKLDPSVRQALVEEGRVSVFFIYSIICKYKAPFYYYFTHFELLQVRA
jgi:hypothetical protein